MVVAHGHIDRLRIRSRLPALVRWTPRSPMARLATDKAAIFVLVLTLIVLLTLLFEVGSLDRILSLELLEFFLHHIGARCSLGPFGV